MKIAPPSIFLVCLAVLAACGESTAGDPNACEMATTGLEACTGASLEAPFSAECTADEAESAQGLLDELERSNCDGPMAGKADGFWCDYWDPLGWCDEPLPALGPEPAGEATVYPILLAHGFNTSTTNFWRFNDVDVALANDGHHVTLGSVPPFDTPMVRAEFLAQQVDALIEETGAEKVNLICFSQGGIDCRYLVSPGGLDYGDRVATLSAISSPHRGTFVADAAIAILPDSASWQGDVVDALTAWYGGTFSELAQDSHFVDAMDSMSEARMVEFNETVIDHADVYYQSWAGFSYVAGLPNPIDSIVDDCRDESGESLIMWHEGTRDVMDVLLAPSAPIIAHGTEFRPNDGVSTVLSSHWGKFRGCIPADHLDQVGQINDAGPDRRTGFDYLRFYRNIAFELAAMGY